MVGRQHRRTPCDRETARRVSQIQKALTVMADDLRLRAVEPHDLPVFYEHQLDAEAARMAGFVSRDRAAFDAHWATNILGNPDAIARTIVVDGAVAGNIGSCCWTGFVSSVTGSATSTGAEASRRPHSLRFSRS